MRARSDGLVVLTHFSTQANAAAQTKGLTNGSKDVGKVAGMDGDGGEGEDEDTDGIDDDHSSAALASVREPLC